MAKKRKSESAGLDEVERTLYTSFCTAANSISQLYTQAQHQQKLAFQAGERHCTEKLYQWLQREYEAGSNLSMSEIFNYLQNELDGEDMTMSSGPQFQQQLPLSQQHQLLSTNNQAPASTVVYPGLSNVGRIGVPVDQTKISVFTNALSSPNRTSLPLCGIVQGGYGSLNVSYGGSGGRRLVGGADQYHEAAPEEQVPPSSVQAHIRSSVPSESHTATTVYGYNPLPTQHQDSYVVVENDSMDMHAEGVSEDYLQ